MPLRAAAYSFRRLLLPLFCSAVEFFALLYDLAWHLACGMNYLQCQSNFSDANCSKFYQELQKEVKVATHIKHLSSFSIKSAETRNNKYFVLKLIVRMYGWPKKDKNKKRLLHSGALTIVRLYSATFLHVAGPWVMLHCVTAFTCFCPFYAIPTSLQFCRKVLLFLVKKHSFPLIPPAVHVNRVTRPKVVQELPYVTVLECPYLSDLVPTSSYLAFVHLRHQVVTNASVHTTRVIIGVGV